MPNLFLVEILASDAMGKKSADTLYIRKHSTGSHRLILRAAGKQNANLQYRHLFFQHAAAQGEKGGIGEESGIQYLPSS